MIFGTVYFFFTLTYLDNVRGRGPVANILAVGTTVINTTSFGAERYSQALGVNLRILILNLEIVCEDVDYIFLA
jgi:hypothetical protein